MMLRERIHRLGPVRRFCDDAQIGFVADDVDDARAHQRVVINDENTVGLGHGVGMLNAGGSHASTTSVPARGAVTIVSEPPMRSARSCILVRPNPAPKRSFAIPRPSSATESLNPTDRVDAA